MVTLNAASLTALIDANLAAATAEKIEDAAINRIAGNGYIMSPLSGSEGAKTKNCSQAEHGWIITVAVAIYAKEYRSSGFTSSNINLGGLSSSSGTGADNPEVLAQKAATALKVIEQSDWTRAII